MAGVRLGYVGHSILAALGVAAIIAASPVLFEALRWFGVAYLIYLAFQLVRSAARTGSLTLSAEPSRKQLRRGLLTALLDAKGMMIYFAILPQFMDHTRPVGLQALVLCAAKRMIVEVNENMPRVFGEGAQLHISEVDAIVENHVPLLELPSRAPTPEDEVIGRIIADMMPDGACLQMGVGALPNLVCTALRERNDLGIHTEALCSGLIDLIQAGAVTNRRKALDRGKTVFTFAMGQKAMTTSSTAIQRLRASRSTTSMIRESSRRTTTLFRSTRRCRST
jgi:hypothetical protein